MGASSNTLQLSITGTLRDIPPSDWENLFGKDLIENYDYQKNLEEAKLKEFSFQYLIARRNQKIVAILPFFIMEFNLAALIPHPFSYLASICSYFLKIKVIFLGAPTTEEFRLGIEKNEDLSLFLDAALEKVCAFSRKEKVESLAFYNLSDKYKTLANYLTKKRFIRLESLATTMIKIDSSSVEDYLLTLSKNMRKDIRRKLKHSGQLAKLRTEIREDIDGISDEIYRLYMNNFNESDVHFEILTPDFFKNICRNMPGVAKYFITYDENKIVAFNLCLVKGDLFIDKFIGFDSELALKYHLYFTTFFYNLNWCIKNGIHYYQPGTTDYHPKIRLGAKLIPLYIYAKSRNLLLNLFVRIFARWIEPKNLDSTLKEIKELKNGDLG